MESYAALSAFVSPAESKSRSVYVGPQMFASYTSASMNPNIKIHNATIVAKEGIFEKALLNSEFAEKAIELLIKAVDNRTKERDYFKLYCDMLDNSITEEEFDSIVNENMDEYVIKEDDEPDIDKVLVALELAKKIRCIDSVEDMASLFSFKLDKIKALAK